MLITIEIKHCGYCRHRDHSGAFTPGGAKKICGHPDITDCIKKLKPETRHDDANRNDKDYDVTAQCYYWGNRVVEEDIEKKQIPFFCPLKNGSSY